MPTESLGRSLYFVTFIDGHSRYSWIYTIKAEVFSTFQTWLTLVSNQTKKGFKYFEVTVREYMSLIFTKFSEEKEFFTAQLFPTNLGGTNEPHTS